MSGGKILQNSGRNLLCKDSAHSQSASEDAPVQKLSIPPTSFQSDFLRPNTKVRPFFSRWQRGLFISQVTAKYHHDHIAIQSPPQVASTLGITLWELDLFLTSCLCVSTVSDGGTDQQLPSASIKHWSVCPTPPLPIFGALGQLNHFCCFKYISVYSHICKYKIEAKYLLSPHSFPFPYP